jgi:hypothetical protein
LHHRLVASLLFDDREYVWFVRKGQRIWGADFSAASAEHDAVIWVLDDERRWVAFNGEHVVGTELEALGISIAQVARLVLYDG